MGAFGIDEHEMSLESDVAKLKKTLKLTAKLLDDKKAHIKKLEAALYESVSLLNDINGTCPADSTYTDENWNGCLFEKCDMSPDQSQKCWVLYLLRKIIPEEE